MTIRLACTICQLKKLELADLDAYENIFGNCRGFVWRSDRSAHVARERIQPVPVPSYRHRSLTPLTILTFGQLECGISQRGAAYTASALSKLKSEVRILLASQLGVQKSQAGSIRHVAQLKNKH